MIEIGVGLGHNYIILTDLIYKELVMKKLLICILTLLFSCGLYAQDISVKNGWQLLGAIEDINISKFDNSCVDVVWKYDSSNSSFPQWKLHIANGQTYTIPSTISLISSLNQSEGFWLKGNDICEINTTISSDTNDSETQIDDNSTITHNGFTYEIVISPFTSEVWLDRNLGASQVCTSTDDASCFGDYYQFGRLFDGHQLSNSTTTITQSDDISNAGSSFILYDSSTNGFYDWVTNDINGSLRSAVWSSIDGSGICPVGFRVPTIEELEVEITNGGTSANFLNIPQAGSRSGTTGALSQTTYGILGTVSILFNSIYYPKVMYYDSFSSSSDTESLLGGVSIRCLKE